MYVTVARSDEPVDIFGAFLMVYVTISVILSKYVGWDLLWFALGFWLLKPPLKEKYIQRSSGTIRKRRRKKRVIKNGQQESNFA